MTNFCLNGWVDWEEEVAYGDRLGHANNEAGGRKKVL